MDANFPLRFASTLVRRTPTKESFVGFIPREISEACVVGERKQQCTAGRARISNIRSKAGVGLLNAGWKVSEAEQRFQRSLMGTEPQNGGGKKKKERAK